MRMFFQDNDRSPGKEDYVCKQFIERIGEIIETGKQYGLSAGHCLCMIARNYEHMLVKDVSLWRTIPFGRMDEIKEFIANNAFRFYAIMNPKGHSALMQMKDAQAKKYQLNYNTNGNQGND